MFCGRWKLSTCPCPSHCRKPTLNSSILVGRGGCRSRHNGERVHRGTLIGVFDTDADHRGPRNVLAVTLAKCEPFQLGRLASAFGMTDEHLRRLRRREETAGLGALLGLRRGKTTRVTPELRTAWFAMFEAGRMPVDAYREQRGVLREH